MTISLKIHGLTLQYDSAPILNGLEFEMKKGSMVALLGANGAGKSTLLKCIGKTLGIQEGNIFLEGQNIKDVSQKELARCLAVVPQETKIDFDFSVEELVKMGRFPHLKKFQREQKQEKEIAEESMELTGTLHLAQRSYGTLSGGEKQRVLLARALCQKPEVLLLDEPTSGLDIGYQHDILALVKRLNRQQGVTILAAIHDLNLATRYFNQFILLPDQTIEGVGPAEKVLTPENLEKAYGVSTVISRNMLDGRIQVDVVQPRSTMPIDEQKKRVHVVAGGEEGLGILSLLYEQGCNLSVAPISVQDSSYRFARHHGLPVLQVDPYSPISDEVYFEHLEQIRASQCVVVPPIPFGVGNQRNMDAVETAAAEGKEIIFVMPWMIRQQDYTRGQVTKMLDRLLENGAHQVKGKEELPALIEQICGHK